MISVPGNVENQTHAEVRPFSSAVSHAHRKQRHSGVNTQFETGVSETTLNMFSNCSQFIGVRAGRLFNIIIYQLWQKGIMKI